MVDINRIHSSAENVGDYFVYQGKFLDERVVAGELVEAPPDEDGETCDGGGATLVAPSAKTEALVARLKTDLRARVDGGGRKTKAVVFSQFVKHLTLIREMLEQEGITYEYLDGSTAAKARQERVDSFQNGDANVQSDRSTPQAAEMTEPAPVAAPHSGQDDMGSSAELAPAVEESTKDSLLLVGGGAAVVIVLVAVLMMRRR